MASTGEVWKLGHRPALDGLRGIAVLLVVASHAGAGYGGGVGVNLFFALSGFLITSLLLEEVESTGGVILVAFYVRRARRLLPALVAVVVAVALFGTAFALGDWWGRGRDYLAALFYATNFLAVGGETSALGHTWSLAIEEQFYLTWPLLLLLAARLGARRRAVALVAVALALTSAAWGWHLLESGAAGYRVSFGVDTRTSPILAGCALAALMHGSRTPIGLQIPRVAGMVSTAVLVALCGYGGGFGAWGTPATATASVGLLWAIVAVPGWTAVLERRPLLWLGRRSYAIYLWHYPVDVVVHTLVPEIEPAARLAVVLSLTLPVAALSWRFVEEPFLRGRDAKNAWHLADLGDGHPAARGDGQPRGTRNVQHAGHDVLSRSDLELGSGLGG